MRKRWTLEEVSILKENYGKLSYKDISKLIPNRAIGQIRDKSVYDGLTNGNPYKMMSLARKKYSVDLNYFLVPNLENSYWAGFIAADGCILSKGNYITIQIQESDRNHLEKFAKCISYDGIITKSIRERNDKMYEYCAISINSDQSTISDLENNFNITQRKTYTLKPPSDLDESCRLSYIMGYIDGDGWVKKRVHSGSNRNDILCEVGACGTKDVLKYIKQHFDQLASSTQKKYAKVCSVKNNKSYRYSIGSNRAKKIIDIFTKLDVPYLKRKWDK